jgi:transcriptional regulator with XRE-family HTH domain
MRGYGTFLSNLRSSTGLSLDGLARLLETSKSTLSRLENDEIAQPFRGTIRKLVLALAQILCTSGRETERYLELAGINRQLLTEMEEFQLGFAPHLTTETSEETVTLQRWESIYQQLIQQLRERVTNFGNGNLPPQLTIKLQEYTLTLQDIQRKLNRLTGQKVTNDTQIAHHSPTTEEERIIVGMMHGKEINTSDTSQSLYTLASQNALRIMQQADVDCFAVDDLITLTQSHAFMGWKREDIMVTKLSTPLPVPQDIEALKQEKLPLIQKNFVNSSHYRLASYTPAFSDRRGLEVSLAPIGFHDYYTLIPFLDESLLINADGSKVSIREKYGSTALTYSTSGDI